MTLIKLSPCKEVLPVLYVIVATNPINYIMIDWLNLNRNLSIKEDGSLIYLFFTK